MAQSLSVTIKPDQAGIDRLLTSPGGTFMTFALALGNRVLNNSRARAPVDTGYLRSTGTIEERPSDSVVRVTYRASYARWVHDGTRYMQGRPFLADALREEVSRL